MSPSAAFEVRDGARLADERIVERGETIRTALNARIAHARDLLEAASLVESTGKANIACHLAFPALEEIGRHELLTIEMTASMRPVPPA